MKTITKDESIQLLIDAKNGCNESKTKLLRNNEFLIKKIIKRFVNRGLDIEDLFQLGCIGFIKAIDKFDFEFNVLFSTYAFQLIVGEIKTFLRDDGLVKISRSLRDISNKVYHEKELLFQSLGREPTLEELSKSLKISKDDILLAINAPTKCDFIDKKLDAEGNNELSDIISESGLTTRINDFEKIELKELIMKLPEYEKKIVILRYYKDLTQTKVAKLMGTTQVQISRVEKRILIKLRENLNVTI